MARGYKGPTPETLARIAVIERLHKAGMSYAAIGKSMGISRQRVHQILHRHPDGTVYGNKHPGRVTIYYLTPD